MQIWPLCFAPWPLFLLHPFIVYCLKVPFLRTVKYNNFVPYELYLYNCDHENSRCYDEKEEICPEKEECGPENGLLWRRGRRLLLLVLFCRGDQNISVTNKNEEIHFKICISI
jgi:hypothetical protein